MGRCEDELDAITRNRDDWFGRCYSLMFDIVELHELLAEIKAEGLLAARPAITEKWEKIAERGINTHDHIIRHIYRIRGTPARDIVPTFKAYVEGLKNG